MKKVKLSIAHRIVRTINLLLNEKTTPEDESNVLLSLINLENDTKYRLETYSNFNAKFKAQMRQERQWHLNEVEIIDQYIPKRIEVSDMVVKYPECLSPISRN